MRGRNILLPVPAVDHLPKTNELLSLITRPASASVHRDETLRGMQSGGRKMQNVKAIYCVRATHTGARDGGDGRVHRRLRPGSPEIFESRSLHQERPSHLHGWLLIALPNTRLWRRLSEEGRICGKAWEQHGSVVNFIQMDRKRLSTEGAGIHLQPSNISSGQAMIARLGPDQKAAGLFGLRRPVPIVHPQGIIARYRVSYWSFLGKPSSARRDTLGSRSRLPSWAPLLICPRMQSNRRVIHGTILQGFRRRSAQRQATAVIQMDT